MKKLYLFSLACLLSLVCTAQSYSFKIRDMRPGYPLEYMDIQANTITNVNGLYFQPTLQKSIGIQDKFKLTNRVSFLFPLAGDNPYFYLQTGAGISINKNTEIYLYPFWYRRDFGPQQDQRDIISYMTPISVCLNYELPGQNRFGTEIWLNYMDHTIYPSIRLHCNLVRFYNKNKIP